MIPETHRAGRPAHKPHQPKDGPRVNPKDPVEEASYESFPASDSPAFGRPDRGGDGDTIPPGKPVPGAPAERNRSGN